MSGLPEYTMEEVAKHNGPGGTGVWFVYQGKIYDVSKSDLWVDGYHQELHNAGKDLSSEMADAPHDVEVLERYPVIGILKK
jgi:predicted heme/steroid binding protein